MLTDQHLPFHLLRISHIRNFVRWHSIFSGYLIFGILSTDIPPSPNISHPEFYSSTFYLLQISHIRNSVRPTFHLLRISHVQNSVRRRSTFSGYLTSGILFSQRSIFSGYLTSRILSSQRSTFSGYLTSGMSDQHSTFSGYLTSGILFSRCSIFSRYLTSGILSGRRSTSSSICFFDWEFIVFQLNFWIIFQLNIFSIKKNPSLIIPCCHFSSRHALSLFSLTFNHFLDFLDFSQAWTKFMVPNNGIHWTDSCKSN